MILEAVVLVKTNIPLAANLGQIDGKKPQPVGGYAHNYEPRNDSGDHSENYRLKFQWSVPKLTSGGGSRHFSLANCQGCPILHTDGEFFDVMVLGLPNHRARVAPPTWRVDGVLVDDILGRPLTAIERTRLYDCILRWLRMIIPRTVLDFHTTLIDVLEAA